MLEIIAFHHQYRNKVGKTMRKYPLIGKCLSVGIILLFIAIVWSPSIAQAGAVKKEPSYNAQGFDIVIIWGTYEEKIHKFPLLSLEVRNRDPWDNHTLTVFGFFKQGSSFQVSLVKAYWVDCVRLRSVHLGVVGQNSLFVVASGQINVYQ
jgi:hypothetical protein